MQTLKRPSPVYEWQLFIFYLEIVCPEPCLIDNYFIEIWKHSKSEIMFGIVGNYFFWKHVMSEFI